LRAVAHAYARLASGAASGDPAVYRAAESAVRRTQTSLRRTLTEVRL
jgi:hypothetical protein